VLGTVLNGAYVRDVECLMIGHELADYNKTDTVCSLSNSKHVTGVAAAPLAKCDGRSPSEVAESFLQALTVRQGGDDCISRGL